LVDTKIDKVANADIDKAVQFAVESSFENTSQICIFIERVYVDELIADELEHKLLALARHYQAGAWDQNNVNIGPIVNSTQHDKVLSHFEDARIKEARFLLGQDHYELPYIQPTVVTNTTPDRILEQDETLNPVVAISRFKGLSKAVGRANSVPYGLATVVFCGSDASTLAQQLEAGTVPKNQGASGS
jgi:succinate-semialdehyde dehydrogenase/glutarate-semialdehyde dehydrogenase